MDEAAVLDAPVIDTGGESAIELTPKPENVEGEPKPAIDPKADNRRNPDALRKTLKWLRENGGEHSERAVDLERMLGEMKSYKAVAPTVREAREAMQAIKSIGGAARIAELQTASVHMAEVDSMLEAGDPKVLDEIFEMAPKGIAKLAPAILERLAQADPQAHGQIQKAETAKYLESQGFSSAFDAAVEAFNAKDYTTAQRLLTQISNWGKGLLTASAAPKVDPERQAFEKERETFAQEKYSGEINTVFSKVIAHAQTVLDKELAGDKKRLGLSEESYSLLREDAWKYLQELRNADPIFKSSIGAKFNEKSRKVDPSSEEFVKGFNEQFGKQAAERAVRVRYGHVKPATVVPVKSPLTAPSATGPVIDYDQTRRKFGRDAQDAILQGKAVAKDGKPIKKVGNKWAFA